jgi:predicted histidine transporter YuiF (NhaC family)
MEFIVLTVLCLIVGFVSYETIKYNKQKKDYERSNQKRSKESVEKKQEFASSAKVSKNKTQNKRKRKSSKKAN